MNQSEALEILKMGQNVFLTGSPGSGKTHTINEYVAYLRQCGIEPSITASTGIAAIHSWAGIGIKSFLSDRDLKKIASTNYVKKRVKNANVLIIDEVSMLSPQTFSMVDAVCREIKDSDAPFGGMQIVAVGDFFQLPPITKREAEVSFDTTQDKKNNSQMALLKESFGRFAYDCPAWQRAGFRTCYLTEQHRQDDSKFLSLLSAIRQDEFGEGHLAQIEARKISGEAAPKDAPKLFSHNVDVDRVNNEILGRLPGESKIFSMMAQGPAPLVASLKKGCLSPDALSLKVGASVMFTKNNPKEGFVNGTLGTVVKFKDHTHEPLVQTRDGRKIDVEAMDWIVEENGKPLARVTQLPLRLAWAITVHKSQGMSLDEAVMDLGNVFEYGQGYVALSRVRRFSGLHLLGWNNHAFKVHPEVLQKDAEFQRQSAEAVLALEKTLSLDIEKIKEQFILASGGKTVSKELIASEPVGAYSIKKIREKHVKAYMPWDEVQDTELRNLFREKLSIGELAVAFNRTKGSITSRLKKLGHLEA